MASSGPSPEMSEILNLVPPDFADPEADYLDVRAMLGPFHGHPVPDHIEITATTLGGVPVAWYDDTDNPKDERVAFHCHGGGFVACPLDTYHFYGAMLVEQLGLRVVMPDYRLAPEHPYPAAHDDCLSAYRGLLDSGVEPGQLVVMGDSCGGGLALGTLLAARDGGLAMPGCFVSISGWFDLSGSRPGDGSPHPFLERAWVRNRGRDYTADAVRLDDPRVSPSLPTSPVSRPSTSRWPSTTRCGKGRCSWPPRRPGRAWPSRSSPGPVRCTDGTAWST